MFNCWLEILEELPESIIWLLEDNKTAQLNLLEYAKKRNIYSDRIIFAKRVSRSEHMERLKLADIVLDTRIYNGHTTTTDALQSGVPVVTVTGNHFASRVSTSLLNTFNLNELVCKNLAEYKDKVKKICLDEKYKENLVYKLSSGSAFNDFYDNKKFVNELEKTLIQIL
jgi:protein O-GlcNAc transferase